MRVITSLLLLLLISPYTNSQIALDSGLVAHFPFTGNALDLSGYNNHGTVIGSVLTSDRFGNPDCAYLFDGINDMIRISPYYNMSPTSAVSICASINTASSVSAPIIFDRLEQNDGYGLRLTNYGHLRLTINGGIEDAVSTRVVDDGEWHHVVGTYDKNDGEMKVYIDGILDGEDTYYSTITYSPPPRNSIGGPGGVIPVFFDGKIDEVRIYSRALNSCEVQALAGIQIYPDSGLCAYFQFTGNPADSSGNNNHGTLYGPVLTADRFGNPDCAYFFDGINDMIGISPYSNMSPTTAVSICAWINTVSSVSTPMIFDRLEQNDGFGLRLTNNGHLRLSINGGIEDVISSVVVDDGEWHHVAGTYDMTTSLLKVYVDGNEEGQDYYSDSITYSPEPRNSIGAPGGVMISFFEGKLDEIRIYDRALNACEIQYLASTSSINVSAPEINNPLQEIKIYPNPTSKSFRILSTEEISYLRLIDLNGKIVKKFELHSTSSEVDISLLPNGVYIIMIQTLENFHYKKIIKK